MRTRSSSIARTASDNDDALDDDDDLFPDTDDDANDTPTATTAAPTSTQTTTPPSEPSPSSSPASSSYLDGYEDGIDPNTRTPTFGEAVTLLGMFLTELPTYCVYLLFHRTPLLVSVAILFLVIGILLHTLLDTSDAGERVGKAVRGRTKWV